LVSDLLYFLDIFPRKNWFIGKKEAAIKRKGRRKKRRKRCKIIKKSDKD
jgi:hypothetical protein